MKTRVLVGCGLKQAEYEPNMTHVSEQCLSLAEYPRIRKRAFSAGFQIENNLFKNPSTEVSPQSRLKKPPQVVVSVIKLRSLLG